MASLLRATALALAIGSAHGSATVEGTTALTSANFDSFIAGALEKGQTAMSPGWRAAVEEFAGDGGVVFGDVNLKEGPVRVAADGTPQNPGAGGWPTLRYFNADTGPGGAVVPRKTTQKICDEFKVGARMIEATKECMQVCDAATGDGCEPDEVAFLDAWRASDGIAAEKARLEGLLDEATQKTMRAQVKLLGKLEKAASSKDEL